jgi:hypothetical protein
MFRLLGYVAFTVALSAAAMAMFISGGPPDGPELAALKQRLGNAYVAALHHAEVAAREARAEYCDAHADTEDCSRAP